MMPTVKNISRHETTDGFVTTTAAIGVVNDQGSHNGVYVLKKIQSAATPSTYEEMVSCVAASMAAMRGQYKVVEARQHEGYNPWRRWFQIAMGLTWSTGDRQLLYKINPINGLPALVDCNFPQAGTQQPKVGFPSTGYSKSNDCFNYIQHHTYDENDMSPPYHAFSQYGVLTGADGNTFHHGIDVPLVATDHMKDSDEQELHWANVAMHMVTWRTPIFIPGRTLAGVTEDIVNELSSSPAARSTSIATQVIAPYPVQWRTSDAALSQAMQVSTTKLVGEQNYKKYFGPPGDAMNVAMGAAFFCERPHTNQIHLKAMYGQNDKSMPLDNATAFARDITPNGARNRYLQALMQLGAGA